MGEIKMNFVNSKSYDKFFTTKNVRSIFKTFENKLKRIT